MLLLACAAAAASAQSTLQNITKDVTIEQRLGETLPLDTQFVDENGRTVALQQYFDKPVVLALVYYQCPMLCNQIMNGLLACIRAMKFSAGREFNIVFISIDPRETPELAAKKKASYIKSYGREGAESGWHFLTGKEENINKIANTVGYRYKYDPAQNQYVHGAAIIVASPQGTLTQYFYGIEYSSRDLRLALVEASENKIGNVVDKVILFCLIYDPETGKYGLAIMRVLRIGGVLTVLAMATGIFIMIRRERKGKTPEKKGKGGVA